MITFISKQIFIYFYIIQRIISSLLVKMFLNETQALIFSVLIYLTYKHEQDIRFNYVKIQKSMTLHQRTANFSTSTFSNARSCNSNILP